MKRSFGTSTPIRMFGPKTSENSTTTGSQMKRLKRDGSRPKHIRRGASHASSAQEYMKSEWTCDELDLSKQITSLSDMAEDKFKLVEELFSIFSILELKEFTPDLLKEYSINQLKELCLQQLNSMTTSNINFLTQGNDPKDYVEPEIDNQNKAIGETADGIQLSVDDNEYSDFLGEENLEQRKPKVEVKDAEVQANWSSLESSSDDESHSDNRDGEGWMNLWKLEQMEILELEMRARAIRMLLKQQEEEESTQKSSDENKSIESSNKTQKLKTNEDISDENTKTIDLNIVENETNNMSNKKQDKSNECDLEDGERPDSDNDSNFKENESNPKEDSNVANNSEVESINDCNPTEESEEDNKEESNVIKESNCDEELNTNKPQQSNAQQRNNAKEDNDNTEVFSIIKINEDFDEELMEENVEAVEEEEGEEEEEEEANDETIDELEIYSENIENLSNVCNAESDSDP